MVNRETSSRFTIKDCSGEASGKARYGAHDRIRTGDLVLTKDTLYHLSYVGALQTYRIAPVL